VLEKFVLRYLNEYVELKNPWGSMDVLCFRNTNDVYYYGTLIHDISLIFGLSAESIKILIQTWVKENHPLILLGDYFALPTNIVYAPYVPAQNPPIIIGVDPYEFNPRQSIMSRYAVKQVDNNFYGVIRIEG
jgi:hypothetical protein